MSTQIRDVREVIRDEHVMRPRILSVLRDGPLTVPQIAAAIGYPQREVMFWVMGMRKYGHVVDAEADEDYDGDLRYRPVASGGAQG
jgi:hypothetical protein